MDQTFSSTLSVARPAPYVEPKSFGKYELLRELGAGGMARVYLASKQGPDGFSKLCAVKTVLPEYAHNTDFSRMFITEAKVAALLNHPNIVQVYEFGKIDDRYYLAMEWVDGISLQQLMRYALRCGIVLGPRISLTLAIAMCGALEYLHSMRTADGRPMKLIHRDLTPGNILISQTGVLKLTDFGVVKSSLEPSVTSVGTVKGKFGYMSPEQARGLSLDARSDVFALGIVLYEVATGRRLFRRGSVGETVIALGEGQVPKPTTFIKDFPVGLERILVKALKTNPKDRYSSANEMMVDLEAFRESSQWTSGHRDLVALVEKVLPLAENRALVSPSESRDVRDDEPTAMGTAATAKSATALNASGVGLMEVALLSGCALLISGLAWMLFLT